MNNEKLQREVDNIIGMAEQGNTAQANELMLALIHEQRREAVDQALVLAYQECCRKKVAEHGPDEFYEPILSRMFPPAA